MRRVRLDPWLLAFHLAVVYTSDYILTCSEFADGRSEAFGAMAQTAGENGCAEMPMNHNNRAPLSPALNSKSPGATVPTIGRVTTESPGSATGATASPG